MKIVALQTARAGSKSVPNKNITEVDGYPLFYHNILECLKTNSVEKVFISTDCQFIKKYDFPDKVQIIDRPAFLCEDNSSHKETMKHGIKAIEESLNREVDYVLILLGNSCGMSADDIEKSIDILQNNPQYDSVESVSKFNMFNPFRAMKIVDNKIETFLEEKQIIANKNNNLINDKKSAGDIYFFNGSFWLTRRKNIFSNTGKLPYKWLGNNIYPYIQKTCMEVDDKWQLEFLKNKMENIE
jgi:CMP-N-acetylneuraminic acid synthetase